jgi:hypothetical protein
MYIILRSPFFLDKCADFTVLSNIISLIEFINLVSVSVAVDWTSDTISNRINNIDH